MAQALRVVTEPDEPVSHVPYTLRQGSELSGIPYTSFCRAIRTGEVPACLVLSFGPRSKRLAREGFNAWISGRLPEEVIR